MKNSRRVAVGFAAAVALVGIAGAIAYSILADPERLKRIAREKAGGRELVIGDMSLALLPWPTLHASGVTMGEAPGDKDHVKLRADRLEVGIAFWPLLVGNVQPNGGHFDGEIERHGVKMKVLADLNGISSYGEPDATGDGKVDLNFGKTRATLTGRIPLQAELRGSNFKTQLDSQALNDLLGFFGVERPRPTASTRATFELRDTGERIEVLGADITLGKHRFTGDGRIQHSAAVPVIDVRLKGDRLDWAQATLDAGGPVRDALPPEQMFYDYPWAWPLLVAMQGKTGTIDAQFAGVRMRNGVEMTTVKAHMTFDGDKLQVKPLTMNMLGGSGEATMHFEGRKKEVRVQFEGKGMLLERWFKERKRDIPFTGGPMVITASIVGAGNSMREVAASVTGPVTIRMGPGAWAKEKAAEMEAFMVAFSKKGSDGAIDFECGAASLPFKNGRAEGAAIVGARSDVGRLLTSGYFDLREQALDLRGRVRPKPGMGVGFAAIDGDIRIFGKIRKMQVSLDPAGTPKAVLRAGVAVATLGLSLAAASAADAKREDTDPCAEVFKAAPAKP